MKKKYLVLKASTNSEWDSVEIALHEWDEGFEKELRELTAAAAEVGKQYPIADGIFTWEDPMAYFILAEDDEELFNYDERGQLIEGIYELEEDFVDGLTPPESEIGSELTKYTPQGLINYVSMGEHTGEEFFCSTSLQSIDMYCSQTQTPATA